MTEIYELPQGKITIGFSDKNLSIGLLELNSRQEIQKHNRPIKELLVQVYGTALIKLFDGKRLAKSITLKEGEKLEIAANQFHIHSNPTNHKSITLWKFEGDITKVIDSIRSEFGRNV